MIISHGRQYIFVHIPKTGGTSLALALEERAMRDDILIGDTPKAKRRKRRWQGTEASGRLWKHSRLTDIYGLVEQDQIERYFVFTLVRNPWDRIVSYYHWLQDQSFKHPAVELARRLGFSGFLNHPSTRAALGGDTSAAYVSDRQGVERCDLFLRLECLDEDLPKLEAGIGVKLPPVGQANRSARGAHQGYFSDADAELVGGLFAADIERFGYCFD